AAVGVEIDHAVVPPVKCRNRTDRDARRPLAVITTHHREVAPVVREGTFLDILDPRPIDADRYLMLALAGHGTCMAADALTVIDQEAEGRHSGGALSLGIRASFYDSQAVERRGDGWRTKNPRNTPNPRRGR